MKQNMIKKNNRFSIGLDFDDVLAPFNDVAVQLANEKYFTNLTIEDLTCWEHDICRVKEFYNRQETYCAQTVNPDAADFIHALQEYGDVYIITAVSPEFMGIRVKQIQDTFPDFPVENIIMGSNKSIMQVDILLDDRADNILKSTAQYPVLYRRPWNKNMSGVLAVNNYQEFLELIDQIFSSMADLKKKVKQPTVIALIGPSGSNKNSLARALAGMERGEIPITYTTEKARTERECVVDKQYLSEKDFLQRKQTGEFISTTIYAGNYYGTMEEDICRILNKGQNAILPIDICGALGLKQKFPVCMLYCKRSREAMIDDILERTARHGNREEMKYRMLSMENEIKNSRICDYIVDTENVPAAVREIIKNLLQSLSY